MELIFLGAGSAFTVGADNYHSNMLLVNKEKKLLLDCGSDARISLNEQGYSHRDITDVYISHLHADHAGGLEWLAFSTKFDPLCTTKPNLYISASLVEDLWNNVLSGGLRSLQGSLATLDTYFNVYPIKENSSLLWSDIEFHLVQTIHILNGYSLVPSFGLIFQINSKWIFLSTDTQFTPKQLQACYKKAHIIFHDCETADPASGVHSTYKDLCTLDDKIKAKMWLYHYNPGPLPDAVKDGFLGFVKKGQVFEF